MVIEYIGFILAAFSVIGNDVIQTLGTFIQSNSKAAWWKLFLYIGGILALVLFLGWMMNGGDATYGRLDKINRPDHLTIWYLIPPILLIFITRFGLPVSTTFLILSIFSTDVVLGGMLLKSISGYGLAFISAYVIYYYVLYSFEKPKKGETEPDVKNKVLWNVLQWCSTAFLWSQWLIQDFANIYVYLPKKLDLSVMITSLVIMLLILAYILRSKGGAIQKVVSNKVNSSNIRSATFVDLIYGLVLLFFTTVNEIPMSTTWAFVGILAGREIALRGRIKFGAKNDAWKIIGTDFLKVTIGISVSVGTVLTLKQMGLI